MEVLENISICYWARESKVNCVVIVLECVLKSQGIIVKDFATFGPLIFGQLQVGLVDARSCLTLSWSVDVDDGQVLVSCRGGRRCVPLLVEGFLDPLLLVRVGACSNDILFSTCNICLHVGALGRLVRQVLPLLKIIQLYLLALASNNNTHVMLSQLVASTARNTWLSKVHDIKRIFGAFLSSFGSEMEPLLMSARIRIHLHE